MTENEQKDKAQEITTLRKRSHQWLSNNFYQEWAQVYKSYRCEAEPKRDDNDPGKEDPTQTSLSMPDTWTIVNRQVARVTAQPPNLRYIGEDKARAENISKKLMKDWDRGDVQRIQKRHVRQACLFGWSVRAWSWDRIEFPRKKRVDPFAAKPEDLQLVRDQYAPDIQKHSQRLTGQFGEEPSETDVMTALLGDHGKGVSPPTLSVKYQFKKYEGPKADFLFIGDCFPEPNFMSIQSSKFFIVRRRRDEGWMKRMAAKYPDFKAGFAAMLEKYPKGTPAYRVTSGSDGAQDFFTMLQGEIGRTEDLAQGEEKYGTREWTIWECHYPGEDAKLCLVGEDDFFVGDIEYPYDLDGKIAFTELILIDDILSGVGDSHARIIRGLQALHDRQFSQREDVIYTALRPLVGTSDRVFFENPDLAKRGKGFRLVMLEGGQASLFPISDAQALGAAATALGDEESIMRAIQGATGENNMSMAANVDPQQNRTATGARLMAFNQDVLTKDMNDMLIQTSINADAEMMYLLNRSELSEPDAFDASRYNRSFSVPGQAPSPDGQPPTQAPPGPPEPQPITVSPLDFQGDGTVEAEAGSTMADDDEAKVSQAQNLLAAALGAPQAFNVQKAVENYLIAQGKGKELAAWMAPPQPPPPTSDILKESISVAMKFEMLQPDIQRKILERAQLVQPGEPLPSIDVPPEVQEMEAEAQAQAQAEGGAAPPPSGGGGRPPGPTPIAPSQGGSEVGPAVRAAIGTKAAMGAA